MKLVFVEKIVQNFGRETDERNLLGYVVSDCGKQINKMDCN
jgi:hypothetical protein